MGLPPPLPAVATSVVGGMVFLSVASSATVKLVQSTMDAKRKRSGKPCQACRGKGFYLSKLCKGNATIEWSPLYYPLPINPCQCPSCEGHRTNMQYEIFVNFLLKQKTKVQLRSQYNHVMQRFAMIQNHSSGAGVARGWE